MKTWLNFFPNSTSGKTRVGKLLLASAFLSLLLSSATSAQVKNTTNLNAVKSYLTKNLAELKRQTAILAKASNDYYFLAKNQAFDYAKLWQINKNNVTNALNLAKNAWKIASPIYENVEGIVAGVQMLADYDLIIDAAEPGQEGPDLKLANGQTLAKTGNLFGVSESALWATEARFSSKVFADFNQNKKPDFGEYLPEANVLKAGTEELDKAVAGLITTANKWQPSESDAFTALVANIPTIGDFFDAWKNSRFVASGQTASRDFAVISRLSDIVGNINSWQVIYSGLSSKIRQIDATTDTQINAGLNNLKQFVGQLEAREKAGKRFKPEEAEILKKEAQNRATALAGQVAQIAARLKIEIK